MTPPYSLWNDIDYENADNATKYKWIEYHKWMFDASFFQKLAGNLVANARVHVGYIGSYGAPIGPFERFSHGEIVVVNKSQDFGFQLLPGGERAALEQFADQNGKPNLNLVEPRSVFGGVMENDAVLRIGQKGRPSFH